LYHYWKKGIPRKTIHRRPLHTNSRDNSVDILRGYEWRWNDPERVREVRSKSPRKIMPITTSFIPGRGKNSRRKKYGQAAVNVESGSHVILARLGISVRESISLTWA
jgi:hypothetical protein